MCYNLNKVSFLIIECHYTNTPYIIRNVMNQPDLS